MIVVGLAKKASLDCERETMSPPERRSIVGRDQSRIRDPVLITIESLLSGPERSLIDRDEREIGIVGTN